MSFRPFILPVACLTTYTLKLVAQPSSLCLHAHLERSSKRSLPPVRTFCIGVALERRCLPCVARVDLWCWSNGPAKTAGECAGNCSWARRGRQTSRHTGRAHTDSHDENNNNNNTPTMDERRRRTEERHSGKSPSTSAHQRIVSPRFAESFRPLAASDHQISDTRKAPRRHERVQPTATDQHERRLHG